MFCGFSVCLVVLQHSRRRPVGMRTSSVLTLTIMFSPPWTVPPWAGDNVSVTLYSPRRRCTPCKCAALPGMCVLRGVMDGRWRGRGDTPDPAPASLPRQRQRLLSNCINSTVTIYISAQPELRSHRQKPVLLLVKLSMWMLRSINWWSLVWSYLTKPQIGLNKPGYLEMNFSTFIVFLLIY